MSLVVHPFEIVAHPVRRRMLEVLAVGEHSAGTLAEIAAMEFGTSRTTASYHLRTLREHGAVRSSVGADEPRSRSYRLNPEFLASLDLAVGALVELWEQRYGTAEGRAPVPPLASGRGSIASVRPSEGAALPRWRSGCPDVDDADEPGG